MTDTTIRCFLSACNTLNFTHAAEQLHMTQQAVSKQITSLEDELDAVLFIRNARSIELTEIGTLYRDLFSKWEAELADTRHKADRLKDQRNSIVRIAYLPRLEFPSAFQRLIADFKHIHPNVTFEYVQVLGSDMAPLLEGGVVDICIAHCTFFEDKPNFSKVHIQKEIKQVAISKRHELYREPLDLRGVIPKTVCLYDSEDQNDEDAVASMKDVFSSFDALPAAFKRVKDYHVLTTAVEMGEGITICSNVTTLYHRSKIRCFPVGVKSYLTAAWKSNNPNHNVLELVKGVKDIAVC